MFLSLSQTIIDHFVYWLAVYIPVQTESSIQAATDVI